MSSAFGSGRASRVQNVGSTRGPRLPGPLQEARSGSRALLPDAGGDEASPGAGAVGPGRRPGAGREPRHHGGAGELRAAGVVGVLRPHPCLGGVRQAPGLRQQTASVGTCDAGGSEAGWAATRRCPTGSSTRSCTSPTSSEAAFATSCRNAVGEAVGERLEGEPHEPFDGGAEEPCRPRLATRLPPTVRFTSGSARAGGCGSPRLLTKAVQERAWATERDAGAGRGSAAERGAGTNAAALAADCLSAGGATASSPKERRRW